MDPAVAVQGLSVTYGRRLRATPVHALRDLDLEAAAGEVVGVLGPNGSGKTTLLEVLSGSLAVTAGRAEVLGRPAGDRALVTAVGYQPEGPLPFPLLSASEFLSYLGVLMGLSREQVRSRSEELLGRLDLAAMGKRPLNTFSTGMTRRLALAGALLCDPRVLLLDEPTAGIDPNGSLTILEILRDRVRAGGTVLMTSHRLEEVEQLCDRVYLLDQGTCRAHGRLDDLLDTGERTLVVRDLDEEQLRRVADSVRQAGGEVVRIDRERRHLFALFRSLSRGESG